MNVFKAEPFEVVGSTERHPDKFFGGDFIRFIDRPELPVIDDFLNQSDIMIIRVHDYKLGEIRQARWMPSESGGCKTCRDMGYRVGPKFKSVIGIQIREGDNLEFLNIQPYCELIQ